eukprot:TRINITY_DN1124_c0_g2_i1.p1 TRINITY_DN1124_c0_g2~~TRINITY_DN1124_c0_g2_i1.p1  ORF type:complete len:194 (+),score=10.84 TRINITY_DN1124_c0_g2_i1:109-690(+)
MSLLRVVANLCFKVLCSRCFIQYTCDKSEPHMFSHKRQFLHHQNWGGLGGMNRGQALPAQPLEWDRKIARFAQRHADSISHQTNCTPDFNEDNGDYGENLFWGIYEYGLRKWTITEAVAQWVKQKRFYDYATNTCEAGQNCAAYLQVVWNETKKIGCAEVFCPFKAEFNGVAQFFVCNYFPAASIGPGHRHPY